ncbi:isoleucyl-tRNA synthetase [Achromobacter deleyi]|uniref:isoleucyl-tRNA synthetase n=1 Tax=Achromobacter deleyi TaxID=1353891 RepID=UPI001F28D71F|nr:isoleucyl-tRNA synthetase [Achromobacter deleyi]UIP22463.1 isoleucyl-tRNA synthetase [Achromobacter deleyi]
MLQAEPAVLVPASVPDQGFLARIWLAYCARRNEARLRNLATDMDPHMLEDVGAPDWLINETTLQRDLTRLRNADYMRW